MPRALVILPSFQYPNSETTESYQIDAFSNFFLKRDFFIINEEIPVQTNKALRGAQLLKQINELAIHCSQILFIGFSRSGLFLLEFIEQYQSELNILLEFKPSLQMHFLPIGSWPEVNIKLLNKKINVTLIYGENDLVSFIDDLNEIHDLNKSIESNFTILKPKEYAIDNAKLITLFNNQKCQYLIIEEGDHFIFAGIGNEKPLHDILEVILRPLQNLSIENFNANAQSFFTSALHSQPLHVAEIRKLLNSYASLADIGCGAGHWGASLALPLNDLTFIDPSLAMLDRASSKARENGIKKIKTLQMSLNDLRDKPMQFDLVTSRLAFHHFGPIMESIKILTELVNKNGKFVLCDLEPPDDNKLRKIHNSIEILHDPTHFQTWNLNEFAAVLNHYGFVITHSWQNCLQNNQGISLDDWFLFVNTDKKNKIEILKILEHLKLDELRALGISRGDNYLYRYHARTLTFVAERI